MMKNNIQIGRAVSEKLKKETHSDRPPITLVIEEKDFYIECFLEIFYDIFDRTLKKIQFCFKDSKGNLYYPHDWLKEHLYSPHRSKKKHHKQWKMIYLECPTDIGKEEDISDVNIKGNFVVLELPLSVKRVVGEHLNDYFNRRKNEKSLLKASLQKEQKNKGFILKESICLGER